MSETTMPRQSLNDPAAPSSVGAPRLRVLSPSAALVGSDGRRDRTGGGDPNIPGAARAEVVQNNWYQSDTFTVSFALFADAAFGAAWWSAQSDMMLDIQAGFESGGAVSWKSLLVGAVDHIDIHPMGGIVTVTGRDLSARMIEAQTQETFLNQTASEIVTTIAARHGMTADVTATTTPAGQYWNADHVNITLAQFSRQTREWDVMTVLARYEGFDLYVTGTVLHFHPAAAPDATPYLVRYVPPTLRDGVASGMACNVQDLRMERALTLARDVEVVVRSWSSKSGRGFSKTAKTIGAKSASAGKSANQTGFAGSTQRYVFVVPNLTEDQALKLAQARHADITRHERTITWQGPADTILTPRNLARLDGTGTDFDQTYYVDSITRTLDFTGAFVMSVHAKNHDSRSQAVTG